MVRKKIMHIMGVLFIMLFTFANAVNSFALTTDNIDTAVNDTATYIIKTVKSPQVGSVGGEWAVLGLARSGYQVSDQYYQNYYANVEDYVEACNGVLHDKKYTEYSRVTVALTAIGKDPRNVAGYNLLIPLGDYDKTIWQGINGPIWALIALDSGSYAMPQNPDAETQATRDMYVDRILECQLEDGGFSLFGGTSAATSGDLVADPDVTAMALQALAKYQDREDVAEVIDEALICLSEMQDSKGGYSSWGTMNSESVSQVIVALTELGISLDDSRFVKNGYTLVDNLLTYYTEDVGFQHTYNGSGVNLMSTEQAFYALVAVKRSLKGENSLYRMSDAMQIDEDTDTTYADGEGLAGKNADIKVVPISAIGKTFNDISGHENQSAIEALTSRSIINGYEDGTFHPDSTMTRAEFATIIVKALGLIPESNGVFTDIATTSWYAPYIGTANGYGIVNGRSDVVFDPSSTISRQEAAVMVARAAKLCGMDTAMDSTGIRDMLAQFTDYVEVATWAQESVAFCYSSDILDQSEMEIQPEVAITRGQIAQILYNLLSEANLL